MPPKRTRSLLAVAWLAIFAAIVVASAFLLTACVTGERPSFVDDELGSGHTGR